MSATHLIKAATLFGALALISGACNSNKNRQTTPDMQTSTGEQPRAQAITVTGCLRTGTLAENTWVLISDPTSATTTGQAPTYQLMGGDAAALRNNVGQRVEVSGTVESEQQVATSSGVVPENRAKGTSGTPTVETQTNVDIKRLDVTAVNPTGDRCQ
ncbi:MAG TPA: hypothetical protein VGJ29_00110 [Vicinamibacterales bacterium]|jgi:hypothetical protein